jgi:hypothetical protein
MLIEQILFADSLRQRSGQLGRQVGGIDVGREGNRRRHCAGGTCLNADVCHSL